jgi:hypothetical protein
MEVGKLTFLYSPQSLIRKFLGSFAVENPQSSYVCQSAIRKSAHFRDYSATRKHVNRKSENSTKYCTNLSQNSAKSHPFESIVLFCTNLIQSVVFGYKLYFVRRKCICRLAEVLSPQKSLCLQIKNKVPHLGRSANLTII